MRDYPAQVRTATVVLTLVAIVTVGAALFAAVDALLPSGERTPAPVTSGGDGGSAPGEIVCPESDTLPPADQPAKSDSQHVDRLRRPRRRAGGPPTRAR